MSSVFVLLVAMASFLSGLVVEEYKPLLLPFISKGKDGQKTEMNPQGSDSSLVQPKEYRAERETGELEREHECEYDLFCIRHGKLPLPIQGS